MDFDKFYTEYEKLHNKAQKLNKLWKKNQIRVIIVVQKKKK